ncbi:MAG: LysR family transcriptional regulator [Oscillospiraceae bacterium]|nr:LysR family transcriptional regulator [Oscillospiraceae bacterium]
MTLNQLSYFRAVARTENYRAAAEELYISQPSLSRSMDSLEKELGVILFEKCGRGITLTKSGRLFLEYADRILEECDIAVYKMKELSTTGGRIDIGYVFPLANYYIPKKVRKFLELPENKNVTFGFMQNRSSSIIRDVKKGILDVGFCAYTESQEELEFVPLLKQEMVIITHLNHPLALHGKLSIKELENYPVIGYERISALGGYTNRLYRNLGLKPDIVCECPDENSIQALVRENFGIALVARIDVLNEKEVSIHSLSDADLTHYVNMIWLKNHYQMPAIQRFIEYMKEGSDIEHDHI